MFLILCVGAVYFSALLPASIIRGRLFTIGDTPLFLSLPLFSMPTFLVLGKLLIRIYDVRYSIHAEGITSRIGVLSLQQVVTTVRYEDVRAVEVVQSIWDRIIGVGTLEISTSATGGVEILMDGIASPREIQNMILGERDRRQRAGTASRDKEVKETANG